MSPLFKVWCSPVYRLIELFEEKMNKLWKHYEESFIFHYLITSPFGKVEDPIREGIEGGFYRKNYWKISPDPSRVGSHEGRRFDFAKEGD